MEENHRLALVIAFYLSKHDTLAVKHLGYNSFTQAFNEIGKRLDVKPNTIKNMRDEFDPFHFNRRKGWYQRELRPSRLMVLEKCQDLSEEALREIVKAIIQNHSNDTQAKVDPRTFYMDLFDFSAAEDDDSKNDDKFVGARGITGVKAEKLFIECYNMGEFPQFSGSLVDRRHDACGYDFESTAVPKYVFEVKGLSNDRGNVTFTDKEWSMAKDLREHYILIVVSGLETQPQISVIPDPYSRLSARMHTYTTIAVNWSISWPQ
ncbi:MAG: DUF3883 domain-containing protein [Alicyclobacillus sp.]|nr:DUF3883 domain-containing protein [Alicyclobacillus sp.]